MEGSCERLARVMNCSGCDARIVPEDDGYCPVCRDEVDALSNPDMRVSFIDVMRESFSQLLDPTPPQGIKRQKKG